MAIYLSERIGPGHELSAFCSGQAALDGWLQDAALTADRMGTTRTYVWSEQQSVLAYFSLCPHEVRRDHLPPGLGHGAPEAVPAILLARLALDQGLQGQGLGASLLLDALSRATDAIEIAGGRLIVVDALDENAKRFYEHHGFRAAPSRPARLFRKASDVAAAVDG